MSQDRPILVLQMQRMGDLILTFPLMLWLARVFPGQEILVVAEEAFFRPLMPLSPKVTYVPWAAADALSGKDFHLVVNLSLRDRAARLAAQVRAEDKVGPLLLEHGGRYVRGAWQLYRASLVANNRHNRFHWADLNALDVTPLSRIRDTAFDPPRTLPKGVNKVGLFLGASEAAKRPGPGFWAELLRALLDRGLRPVLLGGEAERPLARETLKAFDGPALDLCGKLGLDELAALGQTLQLMIAPDTGPMHLAAWTGLKVLNLSLGNVNPWETGPYQPGHYVLRSNASCASGCWSCTRDRLVCHEPMSPRRVAFVAARLCAGQEDLGRLDMPGLDLFRSARDASGLYRLSPEGSRPAQAGDLLAAFWQAFFAVCLGLWEADRALSAWRGLAQGLPRLARAFSARLPGLGREIKSCLGTGTLGPDFWPGSPPMLRPFTGYVEKLMENNDHSQKAGAEALALFERLSSVCAWPGTRPRGGG